MSRPETAAGPRHRRRALIDRAVEIVIASGGVGVVLAISGLLAYLLWIAAPLFAPAGLDALPLDAALDTERAPLLLDVDDRGELLVRIDADGAFRIVDARTGAVRTRATLPELAGEAVVRVHRPDPEGQFYALELERGRFLFVRVDFPVSFADDGERIRDVVVEAAYDGEILDAAAGAGAPDAAIRDAALILDDALLDIALLTADDRLARVRIEDADPALPLLEASATALRPLAAGVERVLLGAPRWTWLVHGDGGVELWDTRFADAPRRVASRALDGPPRAVALLLGGTSLLAADAPDRVRQWFPLQDEGGAWRIVEPRSFAVPAPIERILPEARRRGFLTVSGDGTVALFHSTAGRRLARAPAALPDARALALSRRADLLLAETGGGRLRGLAIDNAHPEVSLRTLFARIWYESYPAPAHVWQSTSGSSEFEPKFGLTPLAFGTLKASFYAMLFAIPLALFAALHTAYFMPPALRSWVRPSVELMAGLPTVILGFLAGLRLAPLVEAHLPAVLLGLVLLPLGALCIGAATSLIARERIASRTLDGLPVLLLVPALIGLGLLAARLGPLLELALFDGDLRGWLRLEAGLDYDQRNALVVGFAMGVAVTPIIYAIAEDAIHSVPRNLVHGALALGASRWQTLVRVVLPTASPAIFSAVMIGVGRAVGETMIVLMASGNTALLDGNPFSGLRTFAANIAIELPESEIASSHYRILFLAALVLFVLTFAFNTAAEIVRQRLRARYGSL